MSGEAGRLVMPHARRLTLMSANRASDNSLTTQILECTCVCVQFVCAHNTNTHTRTQEFSPLQVDSQRYALRKERGEGWREGEHEIIISNIIMCYDK